MERLSGLDASFLYAETPAQPLHVCSILELNTSTMPGGYQFDRLKEVLALQISAIPEFRQKLADHRLNMDHPVWVDDHTFDIDRHLHRVAVPTPGGRAELADLYARIAAYPLDRERPLWEMWVIEGAGGGRDRLVIMTKIHRASVDGVMGADVLARLCSTEPELPREKTVARPGGASTVRLAVDGLKKLATRPVRLAETTATTLSTVVDIARRSMAGSTMAAPFRAPATPFNDAVTRRRVVAYTSLDLQDVDRVRELFGVTADDVVTALCSGVLRRYLIARDRLPEKSLVAAMPVPVHGRSGRPGRNQLSLLFTRLESQLDDPAERLRAIAGSNSAAKEHSDAIGPTLLLDWAQLAGRTLLSTGLQVYSALGLARRRPVHNVVISHVPGPQDTLYFLGCRVDAMYLLGPVFHGTGLNITGISVGGKLHIGITACRRLVPDAWSLAQGFHAELEALLQAGDPTRAVDPAAGVR
ncbi:diacylglycerol O-acyltransferase [Mycobacterium sp. IS-1496]|uniref:WS/DGAT/MGAT family O-acyltransferase n=1 Tax=Mycobacterium sp. IS-1496 TaxID=1772284 RepID=UPI0007415FA1|nr:wax ester/triacylglycerol synthase family O-acyltransferase [Mycobacterium sp. IS-1496]KUI24427.1 diacylglycerol O-acyltransferase [Mycobacterium sp. IS-1496]